MNFYLISVILSLSLGVVFGVLDGYEVIKSNLSVFLTLQSIMAAAILVRLNRGIPTVDWKSVDGDALVALLDRLEDIAREYLVTLTVIAVTIIVLFVVPFLSSLTLYYDVPIKRSVAASLGFLFGILISRMAYMVWLDLDIVRLQRAVIISSANTIDGEKQKALASEKLKKIADARIRSL